MRKNWLPCPSAEAAISRATAARTKHRAIIRPAFATTVASRRMLAAIPSPSTLPHRSRSIRSARDRPSTLHDLTGEIGCAADRLAPKSSELHPIAHEHAGQEQSARDRSGGRSGASPERALRLGFIAFACRNALAAAAPAGPALAAPLPADGEPRPRRLYAAADRGDRHPGARRRLGDRPKRPLAAVARGRRAGRRGSAPAPLAHRSGLVGIRRRHRMALAPLRYRLVRRAA